MNRLLWASLYVFVFLASFVGSVVITVLSSPDFLGIGDVRWDETVGRIERDIPYADGELNTFDLFLPADRDRATKLVLYIHAGGFTTGDKADDERMGKFFASKGYVAATINYTLRNKTNEATIQLMSDEIRKGVAAIVAAAAERGYALDGMGIAGGSAGGTLAMIYAYRDAEHAPVPVRMVISMVGPASFEPEKWFGFTDGYASSETASGGAAFISFLTGVPVTEQMMRTGAYKAILEPITPAALVTPDAPPSLIAFGALDKVAPFAASEELLDALNRHGVAHDALVFPNSGHALNRDPELSAELGHRINDYLQRYLPLG